MSSGDDLVLDRLIHEPGRLAILTAPEGVRPSWISPSTLTPRAISAFLKAPVVKLAGSSTM